MRKSAFIALTAVAILGWTLVSLPIHTASAQYRNPAIPNTDSAAYWQDRGALLATYGNFSAAITAYKKALALAPQQSGIYYDLGVAYGEGGQFDQALESMNTALSMDPNNGRYLYGRAWVLLRAGKPRQALPDLEKAAKAGHRDAREHLDRRLSQP